MMRSLVVPFGTLLAGGALLVAFEPFAGELCPLPGASEPGPQYSPYPLPPAQDAPGAAAASVTDMRLNGVLTFYFPEMFDAPPARGRTVATSR